MPISIRRLLAGLIIGLIIFTGFVPMMSHDDFGDGGQAHGTMAGGTVSSDDKPNQDNYPDLHCFEIAHLFMISAPAPHGFMASNGNFDPSEKNPSLPQFVTPPAPPPNV